MAKPKRIYGCTECGATFPKWAGLPATERKFDRPAFRQALLDFTSMSDDELMTWQGTQHLVELYANAPRKVERIVPSDVQARRIGHFGAFRREFEPTLWRRLVTALEGLPGLGDPALATPRASPTSVA